MGRGKRTLANADVFAELRERPGAGEQNITPLPERAANIDANIDAKEAKVGTFNDKCARKGYSVTRIFLEFRKRYGYPTHITSFRKAVKDNPEKSEREEALTVDALRLLERLPDLMKKNVSFAQKARARGFNERQVWEHYNATRDPKYTLGSFRVALVHPTSKSERRLLSEAEKCLDEMANQSL